MENPKPPPRIHTNSCPQEEERARRDPRCLQLEVTTVGLMTTAEVTITGLGEE